MIKIEGVRLERKQAGTRLAGRVAGHEVTFDYPANVQVSCRAEPFLALAIYYAMANGEPLFIEPPAPLDPAIVDALPRIQTILKLWNPSFHQVSVDCTQKPVDVQNAGVLSSFSGGVDSCSTLVEHMSEITHLLTINSFDSGEGAGEFSGLSQRIEAVAAELGKTFVPVMTNSRSVAIELGMTWNYVHGALICLIACSMGFKRFYIPSSMDLRMLPPWGTHPLLDPLWSTGATAVIHDGVHQTRADKLALVGTCQPLLRQLQVCWKSQLQNCGHCSKCVRTMIVLETLGIEEGPFPKVGPRELLRRVKVDSWRATDIATDIVHFLRAHSEPQLAGKLAERVLVFRLFGSARALAKLWLGDGPCRALRRILGRAEDTKVVRVVNPSDLTA